MDLTSRHGLKVSHNDFLEYMAQKLLSAESYDDLLRSEQGPLMQEVVRGKSGLVCECVC